MGRDGSTNRMGASDSILWRIEKDPVLRSTVTAVMVLDRTPDWTEYRQRMAAAAGQVPWLHQVVAEPALGLGSPTWVAAKDFDIDYHLRRVRLPAPSTFDDALGYAAHEAMAGFDRARPLWEFTLVEAVDEGAVLIQKFHHAATDGLGALRLASVILDPEPSALREVPAVPSVAQSTAAGSEASSSGRAGPALEQTVRTLGRTSFGMVDAALRAARSPVHSVWAAADALRWSARLVAPVSKPLSPIMRERTTRLGFGAFDVSVGRVHHAARQAKGTMNDAFVAAVVAGLGAYHEACGRSVTELRMTLPISVRAETDPLGGNRFVPVRFVVPVIVHDPAAMIATISGLVHQWRDGPALALAGGLGVALNGLPTSALTAVFGSMLRNVDFVATNVPGPREPAHLAGAEILRQYAFAPPSGAAVNVALLSYAGQCCIGVNMDRGAIPDPGLMVRSLRAGFDEILALAEPLEASEPPRGCAS